MSTINELIVSLTNSSGSSKFVGTVSPSLTTPTLGVASATSINFGGSTLSTYIPNSSWTPVFTFVTPGTLNFSYTTQTGSYVQIGDLIIATWQLIVDVTSYGTASGNLEITGLPASANANSYAAMTVDPTNHSAINSSSTIQTGCYYLANGNSYMNHIQMKSGSNSSYSTPANLPTGTFSLSGTICYST